MLLPYSPSGPLSHLSSPHAELPTKDTLGWLISSLPAREGSSSPAEPRDRKPQAFSDFSRPFPQSGLSSAPWTLPFGCKLDSLNSTPREHIVTCQFWNGTRLPQCMFLSAHLTSTKRAFSVMSITFCDILSAGTSLTGLGPTFQMSYEALRVWNWGSPEQRSMLLGPHSQVT